MGLSEKLGYLIPYFGVLIELGSYYSGYYIRVSYFRTPPYRAQLHVLETAWKNRQLLRLHQFVVNPLLRAFRKVARFVGTGMGAEVAIPVADIPGISHGTCPTEAKGS